MNRGWTPERRLAQSQRARRYWQSPEGQRHRERLRAEQQERYRAWAAKFPERAALVATVRAQLASGELAAEPCVENCGREGQPVYDWERLELVGWRCYECRRQKTVAATVQSNTATGEGPDGVF